MPGHNNTFYVSGVSFVLGFADATALSCFQRLLSYSRDCSSVPYHSCHFLPLLMSTVMADLIFIFLQVLLLWFGFYDEFLILLLCKVRNSFGQCTALCCPAILL